MPENDAAHFCWCLPWSIDEPSHSLGLEEVRRAVDQARLQPLFAPRMCQVCRPYSRRVHQEIPVYREEPTQAGNSGERAGRDFSDGTTPGRMVSVQNPVRRSVCKHRCLSCHSDAKSMLPPCCCTVQRVCWDVSARITVTL